MPVGECRNRWHSPDVTRSSHWTGCASCCKFCEIYLLLSQRTCFLVLLFTQNVAEATSFYRWASAGGHLRCAFRRSFEKCCLRFRNSRSTLRRRLKCPFPKRIRGQATFSKDEEETMATVVKGFETMNLPLTRRTFLLFRSDVYVTSLPFFGCSFSVPCRGFLSSVMID